MVRPLSGLFCSPTCFFQVENGLDFIRKQPPGGTVYVHCKAGRGRAGTMVRDLYVYVYIYVYIYM